MRTPIKLRAFLKDGKCVRVDKMIFTATGASIGYRDTTSTQKYTKKFKLAQFTGLEDLRRGEIFSEHILEINDNENNSTTGSVSFHNGSFACYIEEHKQWISLMDMKEEGWTFGIIGDVYNDRTLL